VADPTIVVRFFLMGEPGTYAVVEIPRAALGQPDTVVVERYLLPAAQAAFRALRRQLGLPEPEGR